MYLKRLSMRGVESKAGVSGTSFRWSSSNHCIESLVMHAVFAGHGLAGCCVVAHGGSVYTMMSRK
jgi:hypothetical protein